MQEHCVKSTREPGIAPDNADPQALRKKSEAPSVDLYSEFHNTVGKLHDLWREFLQTAPKENPALPINRSDSAKPQKK